MPNRESTASRRLTELEYVSAIAPDWTTNLGSFDFCGVCKAGELPSCDAAHDSLQRIPVPARPPSVYEPVAISVEMNAVRRRENPPSLEQDLQRLSRRDSGTKLTRHSS